MRYGSTEYSYAEPFARALVEDHAFRRWVLSRTRFAQDAANAELQHDAMRAARSAASSTWWRSHFTERCRCDGCSGQETDLLAIFERSNGTRFALHCEVKQPTDRFPSTKDQAANYAIRAACWTKNPPTSVLPHSDAATVLLCSRAKLRDYAAHIPKFNSVITFEEIAKQFPAATAIC